MKKIALALFILQAMSLCGILMGGGTLAGRSFANLVGLFSFSIVGVILLVIAKKREEDEDESDRN